jgi:hypothetical protein
MVVVSGDWFDYRRPVSSDGAPKSLGSMSVAGSDPARNGGETRASLRRGRKGKHGDPDDRAKDCT